MNEIDIGQDVSCLPAAFEPVADARPIGYINANAPVAQLDRALPSEGKGHTFESCRVRQSSWHNLMQFMRPSVALIVAGLIATTGPALAQSRDLKVLGQKLDLPVKKRDDRGTVMKACPEYGAGFYRLAGSDTCVRMGGSVGVDIGTSGVRR